MATTHGQECGKSIAATTVAHLLNCHPFLSAKQSLLDKLRAAIAEGEAERFDRLNADK